MISSVQTVVFTLISALTTVKSWSNAQADPEEQAQNTRKYRRAMRRIAALTAGKRTQKRAQKYTGQGDNRLGVRV